MQGGTYQHWWPGCLPMGKLSSICFPSALVTLPVSHGFGRALWHYLNEKEANTWSTIEMQSKMAFDQALTLTCGECKPHPLTGFVLLSHCVTQNKPLAGFQTCLSFHRRCLHPPSEIHNSLGAFFSQARLFPFSACSWKSIFHLRTRVVCSCRSTLRMFAVRQSLNYSQPIHP